MCGRYEFWVKDTFRGTEILKAVREKKLPSFKQGEVFPKDDCLCVEEKEGKKELSVKTWGIERQSLLINARYESLAERRTFKDLLRCAVLSNGFYEWKNGEKYYVSSEDEYLFLGALYTPGGRFVIITEEADASMQGIHHRMPLLFDDTDLEEWLFTGNRKRKRRDLKIRNESEQLTLF